MKKILILLTFTLFATSCNKPNVSVSPPVNIAPTSTSQSDTNKFELVAKEQAEEIAELKAQIESLKSQKIQQPQIVTKIVKDDSALKIEKCKAEWFGSRFPGTEEQLSTITQNASNVAKQSDNGMADFDKVEKLLEDGFRQSGYQNCLNN